MPIAKRYVPIMVENWKTLSLTEEQLCERARHEFVDKPARRNQQHRNEEQYVLTLMNSRGNDDANAEGHGADQYGERHVVLMDDFLPEMIRCELSITTNAMMKMSMPIRANTSAETMLASGTESSSYLPPV